MTSIICQIYNTDHFPGTAVKLDWQGNWLRSFSTVFEDLFATAAKDLEVTFSSLIPSSDLIGSPKSRLVSLPQGGKRGGARDYALSLFSVDNFS